MCVEGDLGGQDMVFKSPPVHLILMRRTLRLSQDSVIYTWYRNFCRFQGKLQPKICSSSDRRKSTAGCEIADFFYFASGS